MEDEEDEVDERRIQAQRATMASPMTQMRAQSSAARTTTTSESTGSKDGGSAFRSGSEDWRNLAGERIASHYKAKRKGEGSRAAEERRGGGGSLFGESRPSGSSAFIEGKLKWSPRQDSCFINYYSLLQHISFNFFG